MDEMLARLATFALLPLSVAIAVSATRLARLGFYYSCSAQTLVCFRCRQTFFVDDDLTALESHERRCSSPAAATLVTVSGTQQPARYKDGHQNSATSSEVTNRSSCPPPHLDRTRMAHDETIGDGINTTVSRQYNETSNVVCNSVPILCHQPDFERLKDETVRLSTFRDWPERASRVVEPRDLAEAGLFYTGQIDRVQCAFCRGCLRNWRQGDRPADEHRKHFPDCSFVRRLRCDDDATAAAASSPSKPRHQQQLQTSGSTLASDKPCEKLQQSFQVGLLVLLPRCCESVLR